jgi:hypothetical protein
MANLPVTSKETQSLLELFNGSFYQVVPVDEGAYDVIYGFFLDRTGVTEAADSLTQAVITIGFNNKVNSIDIIKEFDKAATISDMKKIMIALFNSSKLPTSKVGYNKGRKINVWVERNIVL